MSNLSNGRGRGNHDRRKWVTVPPRRDLLGDAIVALRDMVKYHPCDHRIPDPCYSTCFARDAINRHDRGER